MASNKRLNATITIGGAVTSGLRSALGSTASKLRSIGDEITNVKKKQRDLTTEIGKFTKEGKNVDAMQASYAKNATAIDRLTTSYKKLTAAKKRSAELKEMGHSLAGAGVKATVAAAVIAAPLAMGVQENKRYESEKARVTALGMGDKVNHGAFDFAQEMKTYGTSQLENLTLVRDALSVFGDLHHAEMAAPTLAKMKFGNAAFYGKEHGGENEAKFMDMLKVIELRGGTKSQADFEKQANMVQKVISATGGRVGPEEWRNMISTGGLAAKGTRDDAFYYQMEPLVQEMGGDKVGTGMSAAYSSLYQGRTTKRAAMNLEKLGLIGDHSKVKNDKVGQVSHIDPGALKGSDLFRQSQYEWMKQVLLPTLAKKGLTSKDQVLDAIGSIFSNKKGGDLFGAMYLQMQQIDKSEKVNRGAYDINQVNDAGKKTATGKEINAEARLADLKLRMGNDILPLYTRGLELATGALEKLNRFVDENPKASKYMLVGLAGLAATLAVVGTALVTVGGSLAAYAGYTLVMAKFAAGATSGAGSVGLLSTAMRFLGTSVMWVGRALLLTPMGAAITALALAAYMIYRNWEPIKAFFIDLWDGIVSGAKKAFEWVVSKLQWVSDKWQSARQVLGLDGSNAQTPAKPLPDGPAVDSVMFKKQGPLPDVAPNLPQVAMKGQSSSAATSPVITNHYEISVTQQPGESSQDLVKRMMQESDRRAASKTRGALHDGAESYGY